MHDCPNCGQACACDGEDTWFDDCVDCIHCADELDQGDDFISPDERYPLNAEDPEDLEDALDMEVE